MSHCGEVYCDSVQPVGKEIRVLIGYSLSRKIPTLNKLYLSIKKSIILKKFFRG